MFEAIYSHYEPGGLITHEIVTVFHVVQNRNGYPHFLIYHDRQWKYISAKHFTPCGQISTYGET